MKNYDFLKIDMRIARNLFAVTLTFLSSECTANFLVINLRAFNYEINPTIILSCFFVDFDNNLFCCQIL